MTRKILDLSTLSWQLGRVQRQPWGPTPVNDRGQVDEWLPARVPGDIRADLIAAGRIPAVESPEGIAAGCWVDDYDWWYRAQLPDTGPADHAVVLEADGIDYLCAIWLDGHLLATHEGMFARQVVPLTPDVNAQGPHELAVRIWGSGALLTNTPWREVRRSVLNRLQPGSDYFSERMATVKAQFGFGWDFAPRLLSAGIWDGLRLVMARGVYIEDLWAHGEPLTETDDPTPVRWHLNLRLARFGPQALRVRITITPENFDDAGYQTVDYSLAACEPGEQHAPHRDDYRFDLEMPVAHRWWPWDQGEPRLYRVTVRLYDVLGTLDEITKVAGARAVRRDPLPGGAPWRFVVNGRPLFLRGANWVPADSLPGRVTDADYVRLLGQARAMGANFLRVWGGGLRERAAFWDTCDRLGIMAWHEFPLACDFFDRYVPEAQYLETLTAEAVGIVRMLRSHPSLIAWCGGNELDTKREANPLSCLAGVLAQQDKTRPWIPASPSAGDVHQWDVWHGEVAWTTLAGSDVPFMSEFGLQALPAEETLAEMFPDGLPASWSDHRWSARKAQVGKLLHYAGLRHLTPAEAPAATQRVQAAALQAGVEACRLRRDRCGGVAIWQFNEPWPAISWAIIDRAGRPKAAYHRLVQSFQPVLVAARVPWRSDYGPGQDLPVEIWLVNDSAQAWQGCRVEVELDGQPAWSQDGIALAPASAMRVGEFRRRLDRRPETLSLCLLAQGEDGQMTPLAKNSYDLAVPFAGPQPLTARLKRALGRRLFRTD